ncbi:MAG: biotin--[acetyl-CoA-carboxylase] ligase [Armatimonadota bacterium]
MKYTVRRYGSVDSTMRLLEGAPPGTVAVAREQTAGRGRLGREWVSPPSGLYLSVVLPPASEPWHIAFVAAVAACLAVRRLGPPARIKWPNDILIEGRKVCGILVEGTVVGFGVNVGEAEYPPGAASIPVEIAEMERELLSALSEVQAVYEAEGFPPILDAWREMDCTVGREVSVQTPEGLVEGIAVAVEGPLVVQLADGTTRRITVGEVCSRGRG